MSSINPGTIDSATRRLAKGDPEAMRVLLNAFSSQFQALALGTGVQLLEPTSGATPQTPITPTPGQATLSVAGANGLYTGTITPPSSTIAATLYFEVSYSTTSNFGNPTTLALSPATSFTLSLPGTTYYWRVRCTYDRAHFGNYSPTTGGNPPVSSSLQSSSATSNAVVLNQTNYAVVDAVAVGSSANVRVHGPAGPGTSWIGVKGGVETVLPSATIINQTLGANPFVGYDGEQYLVRSTLPQVFGDEVTPVGQVGTPPGGAVTLPTITAVISSRFIIGYNVTGGGANISAPLTLVVSGDGAGATTGAQTITGGVLIFVAAGNPGNGAYTHATVTPSGGASTGTPGGGTITGNNGGRLTAIQGNA